MRIKRRFVDRKEHQYNSAMGFNLGLEVSTFIIGIELVRSWLIKEDITSRNYIITGLIFLILSMVVLIDKLLIDYVYVKK